MTHQENQLNDQEDRINQQDDGQDNDKFEDTYGEERCAFENCVEPKSEKVDWIQCDGVCQNWYHQECIGVTMSEKIQQEEFICDKCKNEGQGTACMLILAHQAQAFLSEEPVTVNDAKNSQDWPMWKLAMQG